MEKNFEIKLSVCISVHNTAHLLPRCLDSILKQNFKGIEVVLVNNGSTDNSESIMRSYAEKNSEIKWTILAQEDRGLAQGRQTGINNASGEYIAFLDADDYVYPSAYQKMYEKAKTHSADIVECQTFREGKVITSPYEGLYDSHEVLRNHFLTNCIPSMLWMRLYHRKLFIKPVLPDMYVNNEDMFALPCLLYAARSIYFINEPLHEYTTDNEAGVMKVTTTNPAYQEKYYNNRLKALKCIQFVREFIGDDIRNFQREYNSYKANNIISFLFTDFKGKTLSEKFNAISENQDFENRQEVMRFLKKNLNEEVSFNKRIKFCGLYISYFIHWIRLLF